MPETQIWLANKCYYLQGKKNSGEGNSRISANNPGGVVPMNITVIYLMADKVIFQYNKYL